MIQLKIVVFAPIPSASVRIAIAANPGALAITRRMYRTSCRNEVMTEEEHARFLISQLQPYHLDHVAWPQLSAYGTPLTVCG